SPISSSPGETLIVASTFAPWPPGAQPLPPAAPTAVTCTATTPAGTFNSVLTLFGVTVMVVAPATGAARAQISAVATATIPARGAPDLPPATDDPIGRDYKHGCGEPSIERSAPPLLSRSNAAWRRSAFDRGVHLVDQLQPVGQL